MSQYEIWLNNQSKRFKDGYAAGCIGDVRNPDRGVEWLRGYDAAMGDKS